MNDDQDRKASKRAEPASVVQMDGPRALPRARRAKPPPGIMTAGGMDMARAHAAGITVHEGKGPAHATDEPRVVLSVETDPRRVRTPRRLLEGRESRGDAARAALLPGRPGDATLCAPKPSAPASAPSRASAWGRLMLAAALLFLLVGSGKRLLFRDPPHAQRELALGGEGAKAAHAEASPPFEAPTPAEPAKEPEPEPEPIAVLPVAAHRAQPRAAKPSAHASAPARPAFTPPFDLPPRKARP